MIKFIVFDFDGVFTNGDININKEMVTYNVKDGYALKFLRDNNIKTGCISSFNFSNNIYIKEPIEGSFTYIQMNKRRALFNHLKFDKYSIGKSDKNAILDKWLDALNISYEEVAYIGDDLTDIDILKKVEFSACPKDAVEECKIVVDYICNKKGGECCVREFVQKVLEINNNGFQQNIIKEIRNEFNYQISKYNIEMFDELINIINNNSGNIYFMGVGKSGNIAHYCANLLKSISYKAFSIDILNLTHGNFGCIDKNDLIILFSNSGNTQEIINIIPLLKNKNVNNIIGICSNENSKFKELCIYTFIIPFNKEISGEIDKIPSNSCMSQLIFSNILISLLKKNKNLDEYKINHSSGNIGYCLLKIKDVLITEFPKIYLKEEVKITQVLIEMTKYKIGCCFFLNEKNELLGLITDGDLRRLFINNGNIDKININHINTKYYCETDIDKYLNQCKNMTYIPILKDKIINGIIKHV
jgi:arabinose-5-phosphate isomerase